ncbi:MAG: ABC transporter permease [Rhodospirillales bacterium]|nr:ABC transporter permease [Rhodospirillales bacterium]
MDFLVVQVLNGLASASALFLVASGLSIIFGVTRIVNFAHGSFYMLGAYIAYSLSERLTGAVPGGFWAALLLAALAVAALGGLIEITLLRRIYRAPELFQLLATFGLVLIVEDLVPMIWGPQDLLGPRAPGLEGAIDILGTPFPAYDLVLIALGPLVLLGLTVLFRWTRWGVLVRAATEDREMVAALGVRQGWLFTGVFVLGAFLAGLGGAVQLPHASVNHAMDLQIIVEAFVVVVVGGLGSVPGAYLAAVLLGVLNALGIVVLPGVSLVLAFVVMAIVLVVRPWGLLGRPDAAAARSPTVVDETASLRPMTRGRRDTVFVLALILALIPAFAGPYVVGVISEMLILALFATSLHFLMGIGGMASFGHAAYFGLGAYAAALATTHLGAPMPLALALAPLTAGAGAIVFGAFCVRLSGVYLAMLTLAFAQIVWSVAFQWYDVTGGDNGILGVWPAAWASSPKVFYYVVLVLTGSGIVALRRCVFAPFGMGLRACRDAPMRADAIGVDRARFQRRAFLLAGAFAGLAGGVYAFLKGSVFPDVLAIPLSIEGLVMVLLGGVQTLSGPVVGAGVYDLLQVSLSTWTDAWRLIVGLVIVALVVAFPRGIVGYARERLAPLLETADGEPPTTGKR